MFPLIERDGLGRRKLRSFRERRAEGKEKGEIRLNPRLQGSRELMVGFLAELNLLGSRARYKETGRTRIR